MKRIVIGLLALALVLAGCSAAGADNDTDIDRPLSTVDVIYVARLLDDIETYTPSGILTNWDAETLRFLGEGACEEVAEAVANDLTMEEHAEEFRASYPDDESLLNGVLVLNAAIRDLCPEYVKWLQGT